MAASKKSQKPTEVIRTEKMLAKIMSNNLGSQVNGRKLVQPDLNLFQKIQKKQFGVRTSSTSKAGGGPIALGEEETVEAKE